MRPAQFMRVLDWAADKPYRRMVEELVLRSQAMAVYSPDNLGHFGLALTRYAHFTSPIRRYADLLVHRALIKALRLGRDGLSDAEAAGFADTADHITATERRAQLAERDAIDRYLAAYMADKVGAHFAARISGVTRFGLFVTVAESGASGIVPVASLPDDYWRHDEGAQTLTGQRTHLSFRLAQDVEVRLAEASPVTGGLVFHILQGVPERRQRHQAGKRSRGR
jgi:ribonuclease R